MSNYFRKMCRLFPTLLCTVAFGVTPEEIKTYAPPPELQARLDAFYAKHSSDFEIEQAEALGQALHKLRESKASDEEAMKFIVAAGEVVIPPFAALWEKLQKADCRGFNHCEKSMVFMAPEAGEYILKMPGWLFRVFNGEIQHNLLRLDGAAALRRCIEQHGFADVAHVADKYLYHLPWRGTELKDSNYVVVAEKLETEENKEIRISHLGGRALRALLVLVTETGQNDLHSGNLLIGRDGRILFIDTEEYFHFEPEDMRSYCQENEEKTRNLSPEIHEIVTRGSDQQVMAVIPLFKKVYALAETLPQLSHHYHGTENTGLFNDFVAELKQSLLPAPVAPREDHPGMAKGIQDSLLQKMQASGLE